MPNPEFLLHEAIHMRARLEALSNYDGKRADLVADVGRRERELWDEIRQREHAARLEAENPPQAAA